MDAVDVLHAIERLAAIARSAPGADPDAPREVAAILARMGLGKESSGYKAEKLAAVNAAFESWSGTGNGLAAGEGREQRQQQLLLAIEKLRKALARGSEGQD